MITSAGACKLPIVGSSPSYRMDRNIASSCVLALSMAISHREGFHSKIVAGASLCVCVSFVQRGCRKRQLRVWCRTLLWTHVATLREVVHMTDSMGCSSRRTGFTKKACLYKTTSTQASCILELP